MNYETKKIDNCFANKQTWEYRIPENGMEFKDRLAAGWSLKINEKLRRPVFMADNAETGVNVKGMLAEKVIRASFPDDDWENKKRDFEKWLTEAD